MKQVLNIHEEKQTINVLEINDNSFIGIEWDESSNRSIVVKKTDKQFAGMQIKDLDVTHSWVRFTKQDYVLTAFE